MFKKKENQVDWLAQSPEDFKLQFERQLSGDFSVPTKIQQKPQEEKKKRNPIRSFLGWVFLTISVLTIPFISLIRSSLLLHEQYDLNGWVSLAGAAGITIILFSIGLFILLRKVKKKKTLANWILRGTTVLVLGFCGYAMLFISETNTKNEAIRDVYRSLHPIMRVTISIVTLADSDLIITDISRTPEDYRAMGLTPLQSSKHYPQEDGFVYAIDLRTIGQPELRNKLLEYSFDLLGFQTIRHIGTADHLHVALP